MLTRSRRRRLLALGAAGAALLTTILVSAVSAGAHSYPSSGTSRGPNTSTDPYVLPVAKGVHTKSLLTVSDSKAASNGFEMVGTGSVPGPARATT